MSFDLTGHVSLVTGGNNGIGLGLARGLARAGAEVTIWGTSSQRLDRALEELGGSVRGEIVDIADEHSVSRAMLAVRENHGRLDSCFANAGRAMAWAPLLDTSLADFQAVSRVNLDGTFVTLREAARQMIASGNGGSLVATSSLAALMGSPGAYAYAATKGAIVSLVKALAVELAKHGIRANALLPGWTQSGMTDGLLDDPAFASRVLPRVPQRRWGTGHDFEGIAVYLASSLSAYHTGDSILIDGGYAQF